MSEKSNESIVSKLFSILGGIFRPILPLMIGAGLLQATRDILLLTGVISRVSSSYIILNALGDCVFYFLPIYLAFSAGKVFNTNSFIAAAIAGFLVYPDLTSLFEWSQSIGWDLTFLGVIPVTYGKYPSSVLPIIFIVYFQSKVEPFIEKHSPMVLKTILVPLLTMFITGIIGLVIIGPIGTWIGDAMGMVINFLNDKAAFLVPTLIGAFSPLLVLAGAHYSLFPIMTQNLAQLGYDTVMPPGSLASNLALAGVAFAVAYRSKKRSIRALQAQQGLLPFLVYPSPASTVWQSPLKSPSRLP